MENSKIQWTDNTFNAWMGCSKVSAGCDHCYAERWANRWGRTIKWGLEGTRIRTKSKYWQKPYDWDRKAATTGIKTRVFCSSLADVFEDHPDIEDAWRDELWDVIDDTLHLNWLLLTKRPQNIRLMTPEWWWIATDYGQKRGVPGHAFAKHNVWLGTSCENQEAANERVDWLIEARTEQTFLSLEPLLGPIDLTEAGAISGTWSGNVGNVGWVIVGGETGSYREMNPDWARSIRDQCLDAGIPFFMKQMGGFNAHHTQSKLHDIPEDLSIRQVPFLLENNDE